MKKILLLSLGVILISCEKTSPFDDLVDIYEDEDECIDAEGDDKSVKRNYEFFGLEWEW